MTKIKNIHAREVFDSRGVPTLEVEVTLMDGIKGKAIVPSGASKGKNEALELRDEDKGRLFGKGVEKAINNVNNVIAPYLINEEINNQSYLDHKLIKLDSSSNKKNLGANAILATSLALARAASNELKIPLNKYLGGSNSKILPVPLINVINGGVHADSNIDIQEYFIIPAGFTSFKRGLEASFEVFHCLKEILKENGYNTSVGDEGGFAPKFKNGNEEPFVLILEAIKRAKYIPGKEIYLGIDVASSEFYNKEKRKYYFSKSTKEEKTTKEMISFYQYLINKYPLISIEDALSEDDWEGWKELTLTLGNKVQLVGDDLFVTNTKYIEKGIKEKVANSVLIKLNQIGTLTETMDAILLSERNNYSCIISHRSGDSEDTFITDLCVGMNISQIKTGSCSRSERISKYNQLLRLEEELGNEAIYLGKKAFKCLMDK